MTKCAKSGWPVIGQRQVNSGQVKRATYGVSSCGFGTRSSSASLGDFGIGVLAPSCSSPGILRAIVLLRGKPALRPAIDASLMAGVACDLDLCNAPSPIMQPVP